MAHTGSNTLQEITRTSVKIPTDSVTLNGDLVVPKGTKGIVLFVHGSGSSRLSPRNRLVAERLQQAGLATLLFDLLTPEEEEIDELTGELRFDIDFLAVRLLAAVMWKNRQPETESLNLGYFGASTGAAAAIVAASLQPGKVKAIVSRGGRPDLAGEALGELHTPALLIVGGDDTGVIELNYQAAEKIPGPHSVEIVPGATHLFEEPGKLEEVSRLAEMWFKLYLA
jgi:dienelactone hydrolase